MTGRVIASCEGGYCRMLLLIPPITMNTAPGYVVHIEYPQTLVALQDERQQETEQQNRDLIVRHFRTRIEELTAAGVLEGIKIYTQMHMMSCLSIDGPVEKVDRLQRYLEDNKIGTLIKYFESQTTREPMSMG